jgi:hypothetical protein
MLLSFHIGRFVLDLLYVGVRVRFGWGGIQAAGFSRQPGYFPFALFDRNSTSNPRLPHAHCVRHICYLPHNLHNLKCFILDFIKINTDGGHNKRCGVENYYILTEIYRQVQDKIKRE